MLAIGTLVLVTTRAAGADTVPDRTSVTALSSTVLNSNSESIVRRQSAYERLGKSGDQHVPDWNVPGWETYDRLWKELAEDPQNPAIKRYLGLPIGDTANETVAVKVNAGRSAPQWIGWRSGSYRQFETAHFRIYSRAGESASRQVAQDLERVFWIWTQVFFPFWDGAPKVALHAKSINEVDPVASQLRVTFRIASRKKMRVVLFRDAQEYRRTLGRSMPRVEQSTGFYHDQRLTSFFYPSESIDDKATRRHELVHQLFREATRSSVRSESPGHESDFWLVEGIAGYFESLAIDSAAATLGGWDSPRLQFARYRILAGGDRLPFSELRSDGQKQAQRRSDLARWYAHAIARTHQFIDGENIEHRRWLYQRLADLYGIRVEVPGAKEPSPADAPLIDFLQVDDGDLITNPATRHLHQICLSNCRITDKGIRAIGAASNVDWLDLSHTPVTTAVVKELCPDTSTLTQLSLEATKVDNEIAGWLSRAVNLAELDLSWNRIDNRLVESLQDHAQLETLWLTGTEVDDSSVDSLVKLPSIKSLDVQRTGFTSAGLVTIKRMRPHWDLNPLQLRVQKDERR